MKGAGNEKKRFSFFSTNQAIHLEGAAGSAFGVQTVNGIHYGGWGLGVGAGLDRYRTRSYPVFVHLRRQVPYVKIPLFLYGDLGRNYVWTVKEPSIWSMPTEYKHGFYWDAGVQYHLKLKNSTALAFSAGYSQKSFYEETAFTAWCVNGPCPESKNNREYQFRRISLKAGVHLFPAKTERSAECPAAWRG